MLKPHGVSACVRQCRCSIKKACPLKQAGQKNYKEKGDNVTIAKAIERADELRPNPFAEEQKVRWLSELDGKIAREIIGDKDFAGYNHAYDSEKELLAEEAYCDIYLFYLTAMIDFFSRDYAEYNNSILMFNEAFSQFAKAYQRGDAGLSPLIPEDEYPKGDDGGAYLKNGGYYINIFK